MYYILFYTTIPEYLEKRGAFREEHLELANAAHKEGALIMAGALAEPADAAVLIFKDEKAAREFAENDPYVKNGLISEWKLRPWTVVIGSDL